MATSRRTLGLGPALTNEINVTPMIDVLLVLLIIFMAAIPLSFPAEGRRSAGAHEVGR